MSDLIIGHLGAGVVNPNFFCILRAGVPGPERGRYNNNYKLQHSPLTALPVSDLSPVTDDVSRELPVKRFQGRRSPLEVDRGRRRVVRRRHCRLPAWLWWEIFLIRICFVCFGEFPPFPSLRAF